MKKRNKILLVALISGLLIFAVTKYGQRGLPVYNAVDFIGASNGDTVSAINLAIQTAAANGPAVVYLAEGKWGIANAYRSGVAYRPVGIVGASNVTLRGAGLGQTILVQDAPPAGATFDTSTLVTNTHWASIVTCTNCNNFRIENLSINGTLSRQINHTGNPYTTDVIADSSRTDAIRFSGGNNNSIYNVRIDSIQFYGTSTTNGYQTTIDHIIATTSIMGGVYFTGICNGSVLSNSLITNNNCDNVRSRSGNITIINNEISWAKINPKPSQANFAGIYVENDGPPSPQTTGINVIGNRIHDNSSYAVDCFNTDTTNWTINGPTVSVRGNEMYHNANGGVQVQMQWMTVDANDIFDNGIDSNGFSDPVTYAPYGVITHGLNSNGLSVTNNRFKNSLLGVGKQYYGIGMGSPTAIPVFDVHGNTQMGGLDLLLISTASLKSTAPFNTYYGNTVIDSNKLSRSSWTTDPNGSIYMYNYAPGLNGLASGTLELVGDNDAALYGVHNSTPTRGFYIGEITTNGAGTGFRIDQGGFGSGIAARRLGFWDFQAGAFRGIMNGGGDFIWGGVDSVTAGHWTMQIHQSANGLVGSPGVEVVGNALGTGAGQIQAAFQSKLNGTFNPSTTGYSMAVWGQNNNVGGNGTLAAGVQISGSFGGYFSSNGANTGAAGTGIGVHGVSINSLRNIGGIFDASATQVNSATAISAGVIAYAQNPNASAFEFAGYFGLNTSGVPTFARAAIIIDNAAESVPVALFRVNGTTTTQFDASGNYVSTVGQSNSLVNVSATGTYNATATDYTIQFTGSTATLVYPTLNLTKGRHLNLVNNASGSITIPSTKTGNASTTTTMTTGTRLQVEYDLANTTWIQVN